MGTVVSLRSPVPPERLEAATGAVGRVFAAADERFSLYRPSSELGRLAAGELSLPHASAALRQMYELAIEWRNSTGGAFTPHRPDGVLDLSGVVKAWAIAEAGTVLAALGLHDWCLNAGGDVLISGSPVPSGSDPEPPADSPALAPAPAAPPWRAGIVDPADRGSLLADVVLGPGRRALATSGTSERGGHIWAPAGSVPLIQVSILAADIVTADVLATAVLAGGQPMLEEAARRWPVQILAVASDGGLLATAGWNRSEHITA